VELMLTLQHLPYLKSKDPRLYETIRSIRNGILSLAQQAGIGASGRMPAPEIQSISVTAANGIFSISVTDKSVTHLGISYFVEYADNPNFDNSHTLFMGPSRNENGLFLGSGTFYFRTFSQYQNSPPSPKVIFGGSTPAGVAGGGAIAGPTLPPSNGSGAGGSGGYGRSGGQRLPNSD
jgi:hypothetical protein